MVGLVRNLDQQARSSPDEWGGVEIVVVLDGSDDGSREALAELETSFPLKVRWQPNSGPAACRNACLEAAEGEIVYFCDDDLIPAEGTVARHRRFHEDEPAPRVLLGPAVIPRELGAPDVVREWWDSLYERLARDGQVTRWEDFSVANSSAPAHVFKQVGGFDNRFVGYGIEDHEIGLRILEAGIEEIFDPQAVAWHYTKTDEALVVVRNRDIGRNFVRLHQIHPALGQSSPTAYSGPTMWVLDHLPITAPGTWATLSAGLERSANLIRRISPWLFRKLWGLALTTAFAAGVADLDPALLPRAFGRPGPIDLTDQRTRP